jgi:hypothetical protein
MDSDKIAVVKRALGVEGLFSYPFLGDYRQVLPTDEAGG